MPLQQSPPPLPMAPSAREAPRTAPRGITRRALILGAALVPALCFWNVYSEIVAQSTELAGTSLSIGVVFVLLLLLAANALLKLWAPRLAFTQAELLCVYVMQTVSISISSVGMLQFLVMMTASPVEFGKTGEFEGLLRPWALPDAKVTHAFFIGQTTFWRRDYLAGWIGPVLGWSAFTLALLGVTLCASALLRRRWVDHERLPFPIAVLPVELTRGGGNGGLFRSPWLWGGFGISFALQNLAGAAYLNPSIPFFPLKPSDPRLSLTSLFAESPWNAVGTVEASFYPTVIGLVYFLPADVAFSCWFFYFVRKAEDVLATALGFRAPGVGSVMAGMPYIGEQAGGAFLAFALLSLWAMRGYLRDVLRAAFQAALQAAIPPGRAGLDDCEEPLPYRWAIAGVLIGGLFLVWFGTQLGLSWLFSTVFFLLFLLVVVTYARIRAEAGLPWAFGPDMTPHQMIVAASGTYTLPHAEMVGLTQLQWLDLDYRPTLMPHQLEALKIAGEGRVRMRHVFGALVLATVLGTASAWAAILSCYYRYGASSAHVDAWRTSMGNAPWDILSGWLYSHVSAVEPHRRRGIRCGRHGAADAGAGAAGLVAIPPDWVRARRHVHDAVDLVLRPDRMGAEGRGRTVRRHPGLPAAHAVLHRPDPGRLRLRRHLGDLRLRHRHPVLPRAADLNPAPHCNLSQPVAGSFRTREHAA